jgi:hypothetical protein
MQAVMKYRNVTREDLPALEFRKHSGYSEADCDNKQILRFAQDDKTDVMG